MARLFAFPSSFFRPALLRFRLPAALAAVAAGLACGGGNGGGPRTPTALAVVAGNAQTGPVGEALAVRLSVRVSDGSGPLPGIPVSFTAANGSASPSTVNSDATGTATATWTLGGTPGAQTLQASVAGVPAVTFTATGVAGAPVLISPVAGNSQTATVGTALPTKLIAQVTDGFGNPKAGETVTFEVTAGGGAVTGAVQTTNAQGQATLGNWVLGPSPGIHIVTATSVGTIPATFVATATAVPPKSVVAVAGATQTGNTGTLALQAPTIEARDSSDNPMPGVEVVFAVTGGGGSVQGARQTTNAQGRATVGGWILGSAPGANTLTASVIGNPAVTFSATGVQATPAALQVVSGSGQTAFRGNFVPTVPALRVVDGSGNPVAGTIVTFTPTAGSGTVTGGFATSDFAGMARPKAWRLGPTPGPQTLNATAGAATPASFAATADPAPTSTFNIEIRFTGNAPTQAQQTAFNEAVATWTSLIVQDLPDIPVNQPAAANGCFPTLNETIDDLVIYAELVPIDGVGNILGSAGPCLIRTTGLLTIVGRMRFDTADLDNLESQGRLKSVILHEMGHVLGIGTLWQSLNLLEGAGGGDPTFTGSRTLSAMLSVLQPGQTFLGPGVPVENTGGAGTRDGHWRESIFDTELMTGFNDATNPLSVITSVSLRDMGYVIDDFLSDDYSFALAFRAPGATRIQLREVPLEDPIMVYQPGRGIVRVIPRQ